MEGTEENSRPEDADDAPASVDVEPPPSPLALPAPDRLEQRVRRLLWVLRTGGIVNLFLAALFYALQREGHVAAALALPVAALFLMVGLLTLWMSVRLAQIAAEL